MFLSRRRYVLNQLQLGVHDPPQFQTDELTPSRPFDMVSGLHREWQVQSAWHKTLCRATCLVTDGDLERLIIRLCGQGDWEHNSDCALVYVKLLRQPRYM